MWCLISQPNSCVVEVEVDQKAKGQEVLEKVCALLSIKESDYLGLRYTGSKGSAWLNLRNPVERQVQGSQPFRFQLRVKFWVPPHLVLQDTTRHQMYLEAKLQLAEGRLTSQNVESRMRLACLLVQAGEDPHHWATVLNIPLPDHIPSQEVKSAVVEYWVLKELSDWDNFGEEEFTFKGVKLGINPHGLNVYQPELLTIPFASIKSASSVKRVFHLYYYNSNHEEALFEAKCDSCQAAANIYRALTEKHAFYSCDTVRNAVTSQCIRDLKGTIASMFNESSCLGKKYVFDIRLTCREVHDNARRALYSATGTATNTKNSSDDEDSKAAEKLANLVDALTCRICMDSSIDTVFFPCCHVISCHACSERCQSCPLCRSDIESAKRIYLPTSELGLTA